MLPRLVLFPTCSHCKRLYTVPLPRSPSFFTLLFTLRFYFHFVYLHVPTIPSTGGQDPMHRVLKHPTSTLRCHIGIIYIFPVTLFLFCSLSLTLSPTFYLSSVAPRNVFAHHGEVQRFSLDRLMAEGNH